MGAMFLDSAPINDINLVSIEDCGKSVGNDKGCASHHQLIQSRLDYLLTFRVQSRGSLIQDQDAGILQDGTGNGHALALSARKVQPTLRNLGIIT